VIAEEIEERDLNTIGPVYPAQFAVSQAEVKLVADQTGNASTVTIKLDQQRVATAQEVETAEARTSGVDFAT
jgi:hypothetical protein